MDKILKLKRLVNVWSLVFSLSKVIKDLETISVIFWSSSMTQKIIFPALEFEYFKYVKSFRQEPLLSRYY